MVRLFEIASEDELVALNRALLESKFSGNAIDQDVPGSRIIADLAIRVASRLTAVRPEWKQWFAIDPNRREWEAALTHAVSQRVWWHTASSSARTEFIRTLLAPFQTDENTVSQFIRDVEGVLEDGRWYSVWRVVEGYSVRLVTKRPEREQGRGIVVVASDGKAVLFRDEEESTVTDWLSENGYAFVADGVQPASTINDGE